MESFEILTKDEILRVIDDLTIRGWNNVSALRNRTIFRLAVGCGLRRKEIAGLSLGDITLGGDRPVLRVRKDITKGVHDGKGRTVRRARRVPLWWDKQNLQHLAEWVDLRLKHRGEPEDPFVCKLLGDHHYGRMSPDGVYRRFQTAIRCLGKDRVSQIRLHSGRHTFITHALNQGRSLMEVRDAAGHSSIEMTSIYAHLITRENVGDFLPATKVEKELNEPDIIEQFRRSPAGQKFDWSRTPFRIGPDG